MVTPARRLPIPISWVLAPVGAAAAGASWLIAPGAARAAASQDWPPFVLVAGLLLVGLAAAHDGLFEAAGTAISSATGSSVVLFVGCVAVVVAVTAVLNLDTSVAFLTPVLVAAARARQTGERTLVAAVLLLSNAGSLLLPGSNLTNLIVLGHLHLSGGRFAGRTGLPWLAAVAMTAAVVGLAGRRDLVGGIRGATPLRPGMGVGAVAVVMAVGAVLVLANPAPAVAATGVGAVVLKASLTSRRRGEGAGRPDGQRELTLQAVLDALGAPTLIALFGAAVALGTVGRHWSEPYRILLHAGRFEAAGIAAFASILVNNLPAASLLAAHIPRHPVALLIGLDIGPNLSITGSLAWILWLRAARGSGAHPPVLTTVGLGLLAAPAAMAAALGVLALTR